MKSTTVVYLSLTLIMMITILAIMALVIPGPALPWPARGHTLDAGMEPRNSWSKGYGVRFLRV